MEVSPHHLTALWIDQGNTVQAGHWNWREFAKSNEVFLGFQESVPFTIQDVPQSFRGGLGLYLSQGAILVKNASMEKR